MEELETLTRKTLYFLIGGATLAAEGITKAMEEWSTQAQTLVDDCVQEGEIRYSQWTQDQPGSDIPSDHSHRPDPTDGYRPAPQVPRPPSEILRQRLLTLVRGDQAAADRLLLQEKQTNPGQTDRWYWEKVIYDLERDRQGG